MERNYTSFSLNDFVVFEKIFTPNDFSVFSELSGDKNPLHHDVDYAKFSQFGETIIPLSLLAMPLSAVAGMVFPGHRSLILNSKINAIKPAKYGDRVVYSSKIVALHSANRVLQINTLIISDGSVLAESSLLVQCREDVPDDHFSDVEVDIKNTNQHKRVVLTGASGEIGRAVARALASSGFDIIAVGRNKENLQLLESEIESLGGQAMPVVADLETDTGLSDLGGKLIGDHAVTSFIHVVSSPIDAKLDRLMATNFTSLRVIFTHLLESFLINQKGSVIYIGSAAQLTNPTGWENYSASKAAGTGFIDTINSRYSRYGIRGITLAPGLVETTFSKSHRISEEIGLSPVEVASEVEAALRGDYSNKRFLWFEPGKKIWVKEGTHIRDSELDPSDYDEQGVTSSQSAPLNEASRADSSFDVLFREFFRLGRDVDPSSAALGVFPQWDSLRHIELMLFLESKLAIKFDSSDIEDATHYQGLKGLVDAKRG